MRLQGEKIRMDQNMYLEKKLSVELTVTGESLKGFRYVYGKKKHPYSSIMKRVKTKLKQHFWKTLKYFMLQT